MSDQQRDKADSGAGSGEPEPTAADGGDEAAATEHPAPPAATRRGVIVLGVVVAVVVIAAGGGLGWFWLQLERLEQAQQEAQTELATSQEAFAERVTALEAAADRQEQALEDARANLADRQMALEERLAELQDVVDRDPGGWVRAEARYLMRMANERLRLQRDVGTALAALEAADARLRSLADPGLHDVREAVAAEIAALKAVERPDIEGMSLALASLSGRVDEFPLRADERPVGDPEAPPGEEPAPAEDWREALRAVWTNLRELVTVRRHDQPVEPLMAPEEVYFLRENLRLKLESARLALLRAEPAAYREGINTARGWLETHFDPDSGAVAAARDELGRLAEVRIRPDLPDISESLRKLRDMDDAPGAADEGNDG